MNRKYATNVLVFLVSTLCVISIILSYSLFIFVKNVQFETGVMKKEHSLLGDDWPPFFPLHLEREVEIVVEESVHYAPGDLGAEDEWWSERGVGFDGAGRIGADNRTFGVSLYHQEHCLLYLYRQLTNRTDKSLVSHHQHCLNYLREQALCHPDLTLEPGDFATRNFEVDRVGQTHTCRDFETAWDYNTRSWLDWYHFLKETRLLTTPGLKFD